MANMDVRLLVSLVGVGLLCAAAAAQSERLRELRYDPQRGEWHEVAPPPPGTPEGDLYSVRELTRQQEYGAALRAAARFEDRYGKESEHKPNLLIARAEVFVARRNCDKAHKTLQTFLNEFGGHELTGEALRLEFLVAENYLAGVKRKVWGFIPVPAQSEGQRILDEISAGYPEYEIAPLALKAKADYLFRTGEFDVAEQEYARLVQNFPESRYVQYCLLSAARASLAAFSGVEYDEGALVQAEERFREYRAQYPADAESEGIDLVLETIRSRRAEKEYSIAQYYERTEHISSAVFYYESVAQNWPDTVAGIRAQDRLALLGAAPLPEPGTADEVGGP